MSQQQAQPSRQGFFKYPRSDHVHKPIRDLAKQSKDLNKLVLQKENKTQQNNMEDKPVVQANNESLEELMSITIRACKELARLCLQVEISEKKKEKIEKIFLDGRQFSKKLKMTEEKKKFTEIYNSLQEDE